MSEWEEYDAIHNAKDDNDALRRLCEWGFGFSSNENRQGEKSCSARK